jgi:hypothetical protein
LLEELLLHPFDLLQHLLLADSQLVTLGCQLLQFPLLLLLDCPQLLRVEVADVSADLFLLDLRPQVALFPLLQVLQEGIVVLIDIIRSKPRYLLMLLE